MKLKVITEATIYKTLSQDNYEWDDVKEDTNVRKHGIDFSTAALVFNSDLTVIEEDVEHSSGEIRMKAVGPLCGNLVSVVYTERGRNIRIITAQVSDSDDRRLFYDYYKDN